MDTVAISVDLPEETVRDLDALAASKHQSRSQVVQEAVDRVVRQARIDSIDDEIAVEKGAILVAAEATFKAAAAREQCFAQRIEELKFHGEEMLAHSEWFKVLQDTEDRAQQRDLALLASQKGWYRMAIDAATRAEAWDALDQRFSRPYQEIFTRHAATSGVPRTELMSIARRESAFFPGAQSPVGARGLMQIMPATGKQVDVLVIANCVALENEIFLEHVLYNNSSLLRQLGLDLNQMAVKMASDPPAGWPRGRRW